MTMPKERILLKGNGGILQTPHSASDWNAYHRIRFQQIHQRYCPELIYDPNDPEEKDVNNFPLVFCQEGTAQVIGTIRIDLLPENEASFRWVGIDAHFVRKGFGTKMLGLAEQFVKERQRSMIRIPATAESLPFAQTLGFMVKPWALMPQEECMIAVCKSLEA